MALTDEEIERFERLSEDEEISEDLRIVFGILADSGREELPDEERPQSTVCPECGAEPPTDAKFCPQCGHQLSPGGSP